MHARLLVVDGRWHPSGPRKKWVKPPVAIAESPDIFRRMSKLAVSGVHHVEAASVLVVDGDADSAELYGIWLRSEGHSVSIMGDAARALILSPVLRPTVAVLDIWLPGLDGLALASLLRRMPQLAECQYVAVTAYADTQLQSRCRAAGFTSFLKKPISREALVGSVLNATLVTRERARIRLNLPVPVQALRRGRSPGR
jgi:CheY-like chemotaxis protein